MPPLNELLGGGFERGASNLILGPAGTGKSLLTLSFVQSAIARGESAAMFIFDEELGLLFERAKGLGIDLQGDGRQQEAGDRADRRRRTDAGRIFRARARLRRESMARGPS